MEVISTPIFLPATINIMSQLAEISIEEYNKELGYYVNNLMKVKSIIYPMGFLKLINLEALLPFFEDSSYEVQSFLNGINQFLMDVPVNQPIHFFKLCRLHSIMTGYNLNWISSILSNLYKSGITDSSLRQFVKSLVFRLSFQELEFHLIYKAIKFLYVFDILLEYKRLETLSEDQEYLYMKYIIQIKKYIRHVSDLENLLQNSETIFMGKTTSAKGIIFNRLSVEFRQNFLYVLKNDLFTKLIIYLDRNKEVDINELNFLQTNVSKWLRFVQCYLTMRLKLQNSGLQLINGLVNFSSSSQSYTTFFDDKDEEFEQKYESKLEDHFEKKIKRFINEPIFYLRDLRKYFSKKSASKYPLQQFVMINNLFKDVNQTLNVLGFLQPVSTILTVASAVQIRLNAMSPVVIFNKLLIKSVRLNTSMDVFLRLYILAIKEFKIKKFELNKLAFGQYFQYETPSVLKEICDLRMIFKNNLNNVHADLMGLAEISAIPIYNNILCNMYNNRNVTFRFVLITACLEMFPNSEATKDLNIGYLKLLLKFMFLYLYQRCTFEADTYTKDLREQFLTNSKFSSVNLTELDQIMVYIYSKTNIKEARESFTKYAGILGPISRIRQTPKDRARTFKNFARVLYPHKNNPDFDEHFLDNKNNLFLNVSEYNMMSRQDTLMEDILPLQIDDDVFNKFKVIDSDVLDWLSMPNGDSPN